MTSRDRCINRQVERADKSYVQPTFEPGQVVEDHTCCDWIQCIEVRRVTLASKVPWQNGWWEALDDGVRVWVHESDIQELDQQGG